MQYKLKHRLSAALMAGAMCCTMIPAASAEEISTPEIADTFVPEITDSVTPDLSQITENLYNDLPDAPTGSYLAAWGCLWQPVRRKSASRHGYLTCMMVPMPHGRRCAERK